MNEHPIRKVLTRLGELTTHPAAFGLLGVYTVLWYVAEPETFDWHAVATLVTLLMTLFITRTEYRDTQALQAKLDELLRVHGEARNSLTKLDDEEPEDVIKHRKRSRAAAEGE